MTRSMHHGNLLRRTDGLIGPDDIRRLFGVSLEHPLSDSYDGSSARSRPYWRLSGSHLGVPSLLSAIPGMAALSVGRRYWAPAVSYAGRCFRSLATAYSDTATVAPVAALQPATSRLRAPARPQPAGALTRLGSAVTSPPCGPAPVRDIRPNTNIGIIILTTHPQPPFQYVNKTLASHITTGKGLADLATT